MSTIFSHPNPNESGVCRHIHHWVVEDHTGDTLDYGVIVEIFNTGRGPGLLVTHFTRGYAALPPITTNHAESFEWYSERSNKGGMMRALICGAASGTYANDEVMALLHEVVPIEWAEKHLPTICERIKKLGMNWDFSLTS